MIVIIDCGMGNVGSVANMLKKIGVPAILSADPGQIAAASKLILPGVGAFNHGMQTLHSRKLVPVLNERVMLRGVPILGICLGMQLFTESSEEGEVPGLGWVKSRTVRFRPTEQQPLLRVPHMGWNTVDIRKPSGLFRNHDESLRYYFVHSYYVTCEEDQDVTAVTSYGVNFVSAFERNNVLGVQFHPEKSHKFGMKLLENFALWPGPSAAPSLSSSLAPTEPALS
jgi:imidazole glycerol-phosphate synthase subunit HisH